MHRVDGSKKQCSKRKKPDTKGCVLYNFLFMTFWKKAKQAHKLDLWVLVAGEEEVIDCKGHKGTFQSDENVCIEEMVLHSSKGITF